MDQINSYIQMIYKLCRVGLITAQYDYMMILTTTIFNGTAFSYEHYDNVKFYKAINTVRKNIQRTLVHVLN